MQDSVCYNGDDDMEMNPNASKAGALQQQLNAAASPLDAVS